MRIFIAALGTETNTFSPLPTGMRNFAETLLVRRDATHVSENFFVLPLKAWRERAASHGDEIIESLSAFAQPAGRTVQAVWKELRDNVLDDLGQAGDIDVVLLNLHGAMASDDCDDCEGELVERVRGVTGPNVTIGVELDLHCHITPRLMENADVIVLYKEYPHTDVGERGLELFDICRDAATGTVKPVMALHDCRMLGVWRTSEPEVRALVDHMHELEKQPRVLSVSFCHGFPWADVPDVGAKTLVVTDNDQKLADEIASDLVRRIWATRDSHGAPLLSIDEGVALARSANRLTVLADISDNAGGGAASDSTFVLEALVAAGAKDALFGLVWDPVAVRICEEAGEGVVIPLRIGGKVGPLSGKPVDLTVRVLRFLPEASVSFGAGRQTIGAAALVDAGGIHIVLNSTRTQTFHPDAFTQFGISMEDYRTVVVKSAQHFYAGFATVSDSIHYVVAPGTVSPDFTTIELPKAGRPLWPQVADPFAESREAVA